MLLSNDCNSLQIHTCRMAQSYKKPQQVVSIPTDSSCGTLQKAMRRATCFGMMVSDVSSHSITNPESYNRMKSSAGCICRRLSSSSARVPAYFVSKSTTLGYHYSFSSKQSSSVRELASRIHVIEVSREFVQPGLDIIRSWQHKPELAGQISQVDICAHITMTSGHRTGFKFQ